MKRCADRARCDTARRHGMHCLIRVSQLEGSRTGSAPTSVIHRSRTHGMRLPLLLSLPLPLLLPLLLLFFAFALLSPESPLYPEGLAGRRPGSVSAGRRRPDEDLATRVARGEARAATYELEGDCEGVAEPTDTQTNTSERTAAEPHKTRDRGSGLSFS